jgi:hypothetical protein
MQAADAGHDVRPRRQAADVEIAVSIELQERQQLNVEAAALEVVKMSRAST